MQANGTAFDTPEQLLQRLGLLALTQQSFSTFLAESLGGDTGSQRYAEEFIAAVNRVNYNQGNGINALVGTLMESLFFVTPSRFLIPQPHEVFSWNAHCRCQLVERR